MKCVTCTNTQKDKYKYKHPLATHPILVKTLSRWIKDLRSEKRFMGKLVKAINWIGLEQISFCTRICPNVTTNSCVCNYVFLILIQLLYQIQVNSLMNWICPYLSFTQFDQKLLDRASTVA